ncbi:hypothetical protein [Streptomyces sp. NPDC006739]|uniref:hypothetical protein n=1 Tax=Streptomyces sp. NPDC006739 TaxID=3364763 RepID=UPI0036B61119
MKLGKALATGVAEERPLAHQEEPVLHEETTEPSEAAAASVPVAAPAPEEVPAAR